MGSLLNAAALPSLLNAKTVSITVFRAVFHCVVHCAFHNASQRFSVFARCFTGNAKRLYRWPFESQVCPFTRTRVATEMKQSE